MDTARRWSRETAEVASNRRRHAVVGDESAVRVEDGDVADALNARGAIKVGKFAAVGDVVGDGVAENGEVGADLMRAAVLPIRAANSACRRRACAAT